MQCSSRGSLTREELTPRSFLCRLPFYSGDGTRRKQDRARGRTSHSRCTCTDGHVTKLITLLGLLSLWYSRNYPIFSRFIRVLVDFVSSSHKPAIHVAWKTVTYRSVALGILFLMSIFFAGLYFAFPQFTQNGIKSVTSLTAKLMEGFASSGAPVKANSMNSQQAHITALDGTVRVKKASSNSWVTADYNVPLEKGDVVQTGSEGMAKIVFGDGTNYAVKQDSLIVIEENSANEHQQTEVQGRVSTGTVDLQTGTYSQGSSSQVKMDGATASLAPESAARVSKDPKSEQDEMLITKGSGTVERNGESLKLSEWEKTSFKPNSAHMEKIKEIGPPMPISPATMMPIFMTHEPKPVEFSWTPMANARGYRLQISRNPYFSSVIVDRKLNSADVMVAGLTEGPYYWMVRSFDGE